MNLRCFILLGLLLLPPGLTGGKLAAAPATEILARVHWLGLQEISADTNSAHFMSVWRLPQTAALVAQTLDKFSRWPAHGATNAARTLLRPLLDDLISSESYLELRAPTNSQPSTALRMPSGLNLQLFLALHLPADRARLWRTNLAAALEALTGGHLVPARDGWVLQQSNAPERIEFSRVGEWTLVSWGPGANDSLSEFAARIARARAPKATNFWLEADLDPSRLATVFPRSARAAGVEGRDEVEFSNLLTTLNPQLSTLNHLHLTALGDGSNVHTRATFSFSRPLELPLLPWEIPTNLIHQPLTSFTAVRGIAPWLAVLHAWQELQLTQPPGQVCFWAQDGIPFLTCFAAPLPGASNQLAQLAGCLVQRANPWLATNGEGSFQWKTNPPELVWNGALMLLPYLKPISANQRDYILGGFFPLPAGDSNPPPAEILGTILGSTNLVYYQSEQTGQRVEDDAFINQSFRLIFHRPQLSGAAASWLKNIEPLLDDSTTSMTQTGAQQLSFTRKSSIGFTALELHLLADWLESPRFPHGLHTFLAPPDVFSAPPAKQP